MGIYKFKEDDVRRFAREQGAKTRKKGDELIFESCPYCKAKDKETFSINLKTGQYECKRSSCSAKGNMITLSRDFSFSLGREVDAYYQTVDYSRKQYRTFALSHKIESADAAIEYLKSRGISAEIAKKYEITMHKDKKNVIVFPFKDENGVLTFIKYRNITHKKGDKGSKEWCESDCKPILFGMAQCENLIDSTLVITEGQIDSLSCAEVGIPNAVSVPMGKNGFTWIPYCWDWVSQFDKIIVFGDCENGIITLSEELKKRWPLKVYVVRAEDYKGCKDANEILMTYGPESVRNAINNAKSPNVNFLKPMAKVEKVDIMKMELMSTGLKSLDKVLDGGFRFGQLVVLTGKRGDGKSTIASMFGCEALKQGYNCFFYSGELPDFFFRNWMDRQISGKHETTQHDTDQLNQWYGEKAYIYDNTIVTDQEENVTLLNAIEVAIVQKNCRFILLDNLMTALDPDLDTDLYRQQAKFVGDLATIAKKYVVFIILVAHPRKNDGTLSNDDISGSSNITDRADITLVYSRVKEDKKDKKDGVSSIAPDPNARELSVLKNRLTGVLTYNNPIKLVFEPGTKRIAEHTNDFFKIKFDWENNPYDGFLSAEDEPDDIPF